LTAQSNSPLAVIIWPDSLFAAGAERPGTIRTPTPPYNRRCMVALVDIFAFISTLIERVPAIILIALGVPMMLYGADRLVTGSVAIARRLGVSVLLIGLTIVSAGTSAPELIVNIFAALNDNTELSFGNVVGSNIANIGLILGIGALVHPILVNDRVVRREIPLMLIVSAGAIALAVPGARFTAMNGLLLLIGFLAMSVWWYHTNRTAERDTGEALPVVREAAELYKQAPPSLGRAFALFALGLLTLIVGGKFTEVGAVRTAVYFDLSQAIIGMTIVAVSTSLPELVTTIVACRRGHTDLAVGNIVGSNVFNLLLILGVTATMTDVPVPGAADSAWMAAGWQDIGFMMALSVLLWWFAGSQRHVTRREGGALLVLYVGYISWSVAREMVVG
jgi:cation:H+ antiporter